MLLDEHKVKVLTHIFTLFIVVLVAYSIDHILSKQYFNKMSETKLRINKSDIKDKHEYSSVADPESVLQKHIDIDWTINFSERCISGSVTITFDVLKDINVINLDGRELNIETVDNLSNPGNKASFSSEDANLIEEVTKSQKLIIKFENSLAANSRLVVKISYKTSPQASGLQWLGKETTKDKIAPFLFSQFQAIHARSVVPCQDIPLAKVTYTAKVKTENSDQTCLMSALSEEQSDSEKAANVYRFKQQVQIPTYLIAIVVGKLESRELGPRSRVWSEPSLADACAYEFAETDKFIKIAEDIVGPYVWGRYDLMVLPPTFPYGGMENPCLTFVTPTLLAGDRSLANVVAHEIAHSWTGNLVGCSSWEHFWLNEGHTVFLERKIGFRMNDQKSYDLDSLEGMKSLERSIESFGEDNLLTAMVPDLKSVDPDDSFSSVPYEKGCNLLTLIEQKIGGRKVMEPWFKAYVEKFSYKTSTTFEWKEFLYSYFHDKKDILDTIDWTMWFHQSGMPTELPVYGDDLLVECKKIVKSWQDNSNSHSIEEYKHLSTNQKIILLGEFEDSDFDQSVFQTLTKIYNLTAENNSEIKFRWIMFGLKVLDPTAFAAGTAMVIEQGRMKFTRPLYKSMYAMNKPDTIEIFNVQRPYMHPTTAAMVAKDLGIS